MGISWLWASAQHAQGERGLAAAGACFCCVLVLAYCVSVSHSIVLMSAMWISIFALCSLLSALYSMTITHKPMEKFSYGLARVPVLAVFSTTVLAQLFSIFLSKESFEHLLSPEHQGSHEASAAHEHEVEAVASWPYFIGAAASSIALLLSAYSLKNQPFQHVLTASSSSSLQEHAADICHAICWVIPGLSRLLLPRINSMVLLAAVTSTMLVLCEHFRHDFVWADPICCLVLSVAVFSTMWPLSTYTGMILLQTAPPHLLNQIDRCISEASTIDGVLEIRSRHFWQLDFGQLVGTMDVRVRRDADEQNVLTLVTDKMSSVVSMLTVQIVKDAAWHNMEGMNSIHNSESHLHSRHDEHGHGHSHDHPHDHSEHDNEHDHNGHGHSHSSGGGHGHSHESAPHLDAYGTNYGASTHYEAHNPLNPQQGYSNPSGYSAAHGHSHDGVTYH
ncbi:cation diffusion facilitator family transporter [Ancylostoma caninum]|uniref:Cation diffusion facilitator family transporter n=1 Tax=Ancylostoma caninum TaxID=29170 RepID=A0A368H4N1_ANCCA|nr:cation diffusion facilitator family transporter [Ancylostoma caninum]